MIITRCCYFFLPLNNESSNAGQDEKNGSIIMKNWIFLQLLYIKGAHLVFIFLSSINYHISASVIKTMQHILNTHSMYILLIN